jgi:hypothetical protein
VFITGAGHHEASWRLPGTAPERVDDVDYFRVNQRVTFLPFR